MDIVFVRHGKAESRESGVPDKERRLVTAGRQKTYAAAEKLKKRALREPVTILTSPAMRALQTALIIKEELQTQNFNVIDALYPGDAEALKQEISALDSRGTCIIVGHEPFLSGCIKEMISLKSRIKKSGYVIIRITEKGRYHVTDVRRAAMLPNDKNHKE